MPLTRIFFYQDEDGHAPVVEWLRGLRHQNRSAYAKCVVRIRRLAELGHELRRPEADLLRDGIYELRAKKGRVQYRILYFFHGQNVAVLDHALTKEGAIPETDLVRAVRRKSVFLQNPSRYTYEEELTDDKN
ncbi:MAG: type II toxin-antitoxin system RelE/ParE family toxin [Deltaproteobacteria bacterium]|nr:type II toxin-antitoxin system RelE/ParE family toxin [Deltaproteobacteria bacterium]